MTMFNIKQIVPSIVPAAKPMVTVQKMKKRCIASMTLPIFSNV